MRIERSVTTVSWIPSDLLEGMGRAATRMKLAHHDPPPPDHLGADVSAAIEELRVADRFRFVNELRAFVEVDDGAVVDAGYCGGGVMGGTTVGLGVGSVTFAATSLPDLQMEPEQSGSAVRFRQTVGGRTGAPMPRTVAHPPFVQYVAPTVWTTLELTIHTDGTHTAELAGASGFPRHWVFGDDGALVGKSSVAEYKRWMNSSFGRRTPWGDEDSPARVSEVESLLERGLQESIMRGGAKPSIRRVAEGSTLVEQGEPGSELFLLLNGILGVEVDGDPVAELGPGAVAGERAVMEAGARTSTLRAVSDCKVAVVDADGIDRDKLARLADDRRRDDHTRSLSQLKTGPNSALT